jgi:glucose/arabinose dehydrogenase
VKLSLVIGIIGLALVACHNGEEQRAQQRAAEQAAKEATDRQRLETVETAKSALEVLGAQPAADKVWKSCEPVLIANALSVDPSVAEACSGAYVELARKALRERRLTEAEVYLDQQGFTGVQSPEADRVRGDLEELFAKDRRRRAQAAPSKPQAAGPTANPADWRQAQEFLADLPPACSSSYASVEADKSVMIHLRCADGQQVMSGTVHIKDGIVTEIQ